MQNETTRSGFVAVIGRPSSGKSTLVNALCGNKVSIVSPVPQTTRNAVRGVLTEARGQIVFLDTPGLHIDDRALNRHLRSVVMNSVEDVEAVLYTVDTTRPPGEEERWIVELVAAWRLPTIVALTKCDGAPADPPRARAFLTEHLGSVRDESNQPVLRVAGETGAVDRGRDHATGLEALLEALFNQLPAGHQWYPSEYYTDQSPEFRIAELVREQAMLHTRDELPHAVYVEVVSIEERRNRYVAQVRLYVERASQQGILVGSGGRTIASIRSAAEREARAIFPAPVQLSIQVKVRPNWRRDAATLGRIIH